MLILGVCSAEPCFRVGLIKSLARSVVSVTLPCVMVLFGNWPQMSMMDLLTSHLGNLKTFGGEELHVAPFCLSLRPRPSAPSFVSCFSGASFFSGIHLWLSRDCPHSWHIWASRCTFLWCRARGRMSRSVARFWGTRQPCDRFGGTRNIEATGSVFEYWVHFEYIKYVSR